ncbi:MAG: hypothetical protein K2Q18_02695 [Bdellovibrionales bacterium]|nr:hypothetical protein [Bdellovibrionales bacterium]
MKIFLMLIQLGFACEVKPIRFMYERKMVYKEIAICIQDNKAFSDQCSDLESSKCFTSESLQKKIEFKTLIKSTSSPGFNLCHKIGGFPQLYEIEVSPKKWQNFERCQSPDLKQFVDIDDLLKKMIL